MLKAMKPKFSRRVHVCDKAQGCRSFHPGFQQNNYGGGVTTQRVSKRKPKRLRTQFTTEQLNYLETIFSEQPYITPDTRLFIANAINVGDKQIKVWFQNRRMKAKKSSESDTDSDYSSNPRNQHNTPVYSSYGLSIEGNSDDAYRINVFNTLPTIQEGASSSQQYQQGAANNMQQHFYNGLDTNQEQFSPTSSSDYVFPLVNGTGITNQPIANFSSEYGACNGNEPVMGQCVPNTSDNLFSDNLFNDNLFSDNLTGNNNYLNLDCYNATASQSQNNFNSIMTEAVNVCFGANENNDLKRLESSDSNISSSNESELFDWLSTLT